MLKIIQNNFLKVKSREFPRVSPAYFQNFSEAPIVSDGLQHWLKKSDFSAFLRSHNPMTTKKAVHWTAFDLVAETGAHHAVLPNSLQRI
jgi:hypothetical protein